MNKLSNTKAVFFDIDGTLLSFTTHEVAASSIEAINRLRENNIMCILATGRPQYEFPDTLPKELFDGFVTINGAYCYTTDEVLVDKPLSKSDVELAVRQVEEGLYSCLFMEKDRAYASPKTENFLKLEEFIGSSFPEDDFTQALVNDVYQLNVYVDPGDEHILMDKASNLMWTRWSDLFIDVMGKGAGKADSSKIMLEKLGINPLDCVAFGDGGNDLGLFGVVGTSVAMGNADDTVKAQATYVTDDCDSDGIYNACLKLGLI